MHAQERLAGKLLERKKFANYETGQNRRQTIHAKVRAAAYDKIYAIASKGSAKQERSAAFDAVKEEVKALFTEEELAENGDLVSKYFYKDVNKEAVRNVTLRFGYTSRRKKNHRNPPNLVRSRLPAIGSRFGIVYAW